jgi:hypothetical protein
MQKVFFIFLLALISSAENFEVETTCGSIQGFVFPEYSKNVIAFLGWG